MVPCKGKKTNTELFYIVNKLIMDTNWGLFGSNGLWLLVILFFLFFMNGNGFGWFGWNNMMWWLLGNQNSNNNHDNTVDIINNNTQRQQAMFANQNQANQTTLLTQGFCNVNSNIEKAILAWQQNTASIIASSTANMQKILDKMCSDETARLRAELVEAKNSQSNSLQTQYLISQLRPYPVPSWEVSSPYTSINTPTTWA